MPTFALVSRIHLAELPYVRPFIQYYKDLGVHQCYFVNTKADEYERVKAHLPVDCILHKAPKGPINQMQNSALSLVKEDYIVQCDCDEYFILGYATLQDLHQAHPASYYTSAWAMAPCDSPACSGAAGGTDAEFKATPWQQGKYIVQRATCTTLPIHAFRKRKGFKLPHMMHLWGRSINDILLKCVLQVLPGAKRSSTQQIRHLLETKQLPNRLKALAYLCNLPHPLTVSLPLVFDQKLEEQILLEYLTQEEIQQLHTLYVEYKKNLKGHHFNQRKQYSMQLVTRKLQAIEF